MPRLMSDDLSLHASGQWFKRIRGKNIYLGRDENAAKIRWEKEKAWWKTGRTPPRADGSPSIVELANVYAADQARKLATGEIGQRHVDLCETTIKRLIKIVGDDCRPHHLTPLEWGDVKAQLFEPIKRIKPVRGEVYGRSVTKRAASTVEGDVRRIRSFLTWCVDAELIEPPRWGKMFSPTTFVSAANSSAKFKGFKPAELRKLIDGATVGFRPVLLLAINAGIGGWDIASIRPDQIPTKNGSHWVELPRLKTGTERRFWLWPETIEAIRNYRTWRPQPIRAVDADKLFLTAAGNPWIEVAKGGHKDSI